MFRTTKSSSIILTQKTAIYITYVTVLNEPRMSEFKDVDSLKLEGGGTILDNLLVLDLNNYSNMCIG